MFGRLRNATQTCFASRRSMAPPESHAAFSHSGSFAMIALTFSAGIGFEK
jgi:hypothetical protein